MNQENTQLLEQRQVEKLIEIGARLRQSREERLFSLEQVATKTLIPMRLLNAIENGQRDQLPEPVYIQGFIKRYAEALGMNGAEFASDFPTGPGIRAIQPSWKESPAAQLRPFHLWAIYVLLVAAAISALSYLISRSGSWTNRPQVSTEQPAEVQPAAPGGTASPSAAAPSPEAVPSPSQSVDPAIANKPVRVDVTLTGQSWLRVVSDGTTEFEGTLAEGTEQTWTAENQLTVRAGNAGGVVLSYNEGQAEPMGEPGRVEERTFTRSQDAASLPNSADSNTLPQ